jgi:hypothetical protein
MSFEFDAEGCACISSLRGRTSLMRQAVGLQLQIGTMNQAFGLGWYETGRWPEAKVVDLTGLTLEERRAKVIHR